MISKALESIVSAVADRAAQQLASGTVEWLQGQRSDLAGEDSGLGNLWLEFCAQVQGQQSVYWDEFEIAVRETVERLVCELPVAERQALWLQTEAGQDWLDETDAAQVPIALEDIVEDVYGKVWQRAADWEDRRLERYLAHADGDDYCEDDEKDEEEDEEDELDEEDSDEGFDDKEA